jgi:hypothetical protein
VVPTSLKVLPSYDSQAVSFDEEQLPDRERARTRARDRKLRGPKVIVDNAGLKKLALERAQRLRAKQGEGAAGDQHPGPR